MAGSCGRGKGKEEGEKRGKRRRPKIAFLEPFQASLGVGNAFSVISSTGSLCSAILGANGTGETSFAQSEIFFEYFSPPGQVVSFGDGIGGDGNFSY